MKKHIFIKFIIGYIIFGIISFLAISLITYKMTYNHTLKNEAESLYKQANYIATSYYANVATTTSRVADSFFTQLDAINQYHESEIMLLRPNGEIIIDTAGRTGLIEGFDSSISGNSYYFTGNFFNTYDKKMLSVIAPVINNYSLKGYILIHKSIALIQTESNNVFNYNYITMLIMLLLSALLLSLFLLDLYPPLYKLTHITGNYALGDFKHRSNIKRNDEIGRLATSLDYMASEVEKLNNYQTKFIANISHDFRSPLTSIKGYIEAMLDGTIPVEMQEKYLNIVLFETERLNKLTSNLLSLNSMNQGMLLEVSSFDINDVIKKTILTFEGTCAQKKIKFNLTFSSKTAFVSADFGRIQQVVYNLIDNAIKFSNSNSQINISTNEKGEKIFISVKDFGIGIPKDSLDKIWDRFYKTDLSRGKDKKGTGLGLSIVKEIINAHKTTIDVISTEGTGTEFIFSLYKTKDENTL